MPPKTPATNSPRLGKNWIQLGLIRVEDKELVQSSLKRHKIVFKIEGNRFHKTDDLRRKNYQELFVAHGYRREAMRVMKMLFSSQPQEEE